MGGGGSLIHTYIVIIACLLSLPHRNCIFIEREDEKGTPLHIIVMSKGSKEGRKELIE